MSLITCVDCGNKISNKSNCCPNCGCPTNQSLLANGLEIVNGILYGIGSYESNILIIPNIVTYIKAYAFRNSSITTIIVASSVKRIGCGAFRDCKKLERIIFPEEGMIEIGANVFRNCVNLISVQIPSSVTKIGPGAFSNCDKLNDVKIFEGITELEESMFAGCLSLEKVVLPDSLTKIAYGCFFGCEKLKDIEIPENVISIGVFAFTNCPLIYNEKEGLQYLGNSKNKYKFLYSASESITYAKIDINCEYILNYAFENCDKLEAIIFPDGIKEIGIFAFKNCKIITNIELPPNIEYCGWDLFEDCHALTFTEKDGLNYIASKTSKYCFLVGAIDQKIKTANITDGCSFIGSSAFAGCGELEKIRIPIGVKQISRYAFRDCVSLNNILIPDSVKIIEDCAFDGCRKISVECSEKVKELVCQSIINEIEEHKIYITFSD